RARPWFRASASVSVDVGGRRPGAESGTCARAGRAVRTRRQNAVNQRRIGILLYGEGSGCPTYGGRWREVSGCDKPDSPGQNSARTAVVPLPGTATRTSRPARSQVTRPVTSPVRSTTRPPDAPGGARVAVSEIRRPVSG